jgi:hypothetical protein
MKGIATSYKLQGRKGTACGRDGIHSPSPSFVTRGSWCSSLRLENAIIALQTQNNLPLVANEGEKETPTS